MKKTIRNSLKVNFFSQGQVYVGDSAGVPGPDDSLTKKVNALNFIAMRGWDGKEAGYQKQVAEQMGKTAARINARFIIATGDSFYPSE